jgi:hypothetical protein
MKHVIHISAHRFAFAFATVLFFSSLAIASVEPVPGIDIIVKKKPGNVAIPSGTTGKDGKFKTAQLEPGVYAITFTYHSGKQWVDPNPMWPISLQLDNIKGVTVKGWDPKQKAIIVGKATVLEVTVGPKGGTISGTLNKIDSSHK